MNVKTISLNMNRIYKCFGSLFCAAAVWACAEEIEAPGSGEEKEYREARVALDLSAAPMEAGYGEDTVTKAEGTGGDAPARTPVKKFWFIEYDDQGELVVPPIYYDLSGEGASNEIAVALAESDDKPYKGVIIAGINGIRADIFNEVNCATPDKLCELCYMLNQADIIKEETAAGAGSAEVSADPYGDTSDKVFLYGSVEVKSAQDQSLSCTLKRNVAKLTFTVRNSCAVPDFEIDAIRLCNVPGRYHYYMEDGNIPGADGVAIQQGYVDYEIELDQPIVKGGEKTFTCYIPANLKTCLEGGAGNADIEKKNHFAPDKATYIELDGTYPQAAIIYSFRYYPGKNMTDDFSLEQNCSYNLPIDIRTFFSETDSRVSMKVEGLEPSNSYIINTTTRQTIYCIPMTWMYQYWTKYASEKITDFIAVGDVPADTELIAEVIWQEQDTRVISFCDAKNENRGETWTFDVEPDADDKGRLYFVTDGQKPGNVLIGVKRASVMNDGDESNDYTSYLWSWHLWITDYAPDKIANLYPVWNEDQYIYNPSGLELPQADAVHRYADSSGSGVWNETDGIYKNKYIMDRQLGAMSADSNGGLKMTGGLFYQYGRKDPFPTMKDNNKLYRIDGDGNGVKFTQYSGDVVGLVKAKKTFDEAVRNPHTMYQGDSGDWADPNDYSSYLWNNPAGDVSTKGIFDPCPPGWMVPHEGTFDILLDTNHAENYWTSTTNGGLNFYIGDTVGTEAPQSYYPSSGYRHPLKALVSGYGGHSCTWFSKYVGTSGHILYVTASRITIGSYARAYGFTVRCVQE